MSRSLPTRRPPTRRPGGRTAETQRRVFEATSALLVEGGFAAVTFQDVAERAGVGRATLYRRWPDPAALVADAIRASAADRIPIPDTGSLRGDLHRMLELIAQFVDSPLGSASIIAGLAQSKDTAAERAMSNQWSNRWGDVLQIFERAAERGEIGSDRDFELCFAQVAGAAYFRKLVMRLPIDSEWLDRLLNDMKRPGFSGGSYL